MVCVVGEECNAAYVLTNHLDTPTELVMPSDLQMGWALSPRFFNMASKTARDIAESYYRKRVGTHLFEGITISELLGLENASMWETNELNKFLTILEGNHFGPCWRYFATIFIHMAQTSYPAQLFHLSR